ncbi:hypothetical protein [Pseudoxanthomonas wuyuanensis]|uniref:Uncharacterized protein n=1 Tax=Pseudoxanthomonas wuyuanensis TaxID=1073196 RepID=A0A286D466_9GAMM|nr:hypothetical protein [Pseudoxanthomonas wuyuanensis]SOD53463.1 hypothetical protein SAMN06296416_102423 [Pseudoxanthomonas wuyuanensis]
MNTQDESLRWRLRAMREDMAPSRDLWPDIAARIAEAPQSPIQPVEPITRSHRIMPWAMAASALLALGLAWQLGVMKPHAEPLLQREAASLTRDYQGAVAELESAGTPPEIAPALAALDRSAAQIRSAIDADPNARFLLDQLRRTYARRLALTQRAVMT